MQEKTVVAGARITASTFHGFDLKYDELNQRLSAVKKEFGLRRAISTHSLAGETRTFAEILDAQVETIVLYYLEVQGILAKQLRLLRSKQIVTLHHPAVTLEAIEDLCRCYRQIGQEVLELLNYLDRNSVALRKIIMRHDVLFDQKMGSLYFDSRLSSQGNTVKNGAQLRQLYRQEGIIAIVASIRRGFEELYDARKTLLDATEDGFQIGSRPRGNSVMVENLHYFGSTSHDFHPDDRKCIPRVPFKKRLASFGNLRKLAFEAAKASLMPSSSQGGADITTATNIDNTTSTTNSSNNRVPSEATPLLPRHTASGDHHHQTSGQVSPAVPSVSTKSNHSTGNLYGLMNQVDQNLVTSRLYDARHGEEKGENHFFNYQPIKRSLSELEPILKRINEVGQRVIKTQERTTLEFLSDQSEIALEFNIRDMNRAAERSYRRKKKLAAAVAAAATTATASAASQKLDIVALDEFMDDEIKTSKVGLYLNLIVTFLYQANQYIVAPTSSKYANLLGMTAAMSGMIIGFSPAAALVSSLAYSKWSNYSFKSPLIACITCATLGNILYGAALQCNSVPMIFLGRLLVGFGGPRVISRRYIADHVSLQDRLIASGQFVSAGALGLVFGPLLASLMERWQWHFTWQLWGTTWVLYESVTAPGWTMALFWFASLVAVIIWFEEPLSWSSDDSSANLQFTDYVVHEEKGAVKGNVVGSTRFASTKTTSGSGGGGGGGVSSRTSKKRSTSSSTSSAGKTAHDGGGTTASDEEWGVDVTMVDEDYEDSGSSSAVPSTKTMKVGIAERDAKLQAALASPTPFVHVVTHVEMTPYTRPKPPRDDIASAAQHPSWLPHHSLAHTTGSSHSSLHHSFSASNVNVKDIGSGSGSGSGSGQRPKALSPLHPPPRSYQSTMDPHDEEWYVLEHGYDHDLTDPSPPEPPLSWTNCCWIWPRYCWRMCHRCLCCGSGSCSDSCQPWLVWWSEQYNYYFGWAEYVTVEVQVILLVYLVNKVGQEMVVSSAPMLTKVLFHWTNEAVGYYMAIIGAFVVPTNIIVHSMVKEADERDTLKTLTILAMVGVALVCYLPIMGDYTLLQYLLGTTLCFTMLNAIEGVVMSLLSKLIAPELAKGTFNSGLLATEAGTLGRVVGDLMITVLADGALSSTELVNHLYIPFFVCLGASLALAIRFYEHLVD